MGIYDRDYYQESEGGLRISAPKTMVTTLILINVGVYLADWATDGMLSHFGELQSDVFRHPWDLWELLTAGFLHDRRGIFHIGFNMFTLWMFGRQVEAIYGRWEFLRMYLVFIVLSSLGWVITENIWHTRPPGDPSVMVGASGGITGILTIFVLNFPRQMFYIWGVIPMPAWLFLAIFVLMDLSGFMAGQHGDSNTAFAAHLTGFLCGVAYFRSGINFGRLLPGNFRMPSLNSRRLRIHDPEADERELNRQVDEILEKIHLQGEASLSKKERRILETASRKLQEKRR